MRGSWGSFLPFTIALFLGLGDSQRDFAGRFDASSSFRSESGSRGMPQPRLWSQGRAYNLFWVHSPPPALEHRPATPRTDHVSAARMRSLAGGDKRNQPSLPSAHKHSAPQSARAQTAGSPSGSLVQMPGRKQRMDSSHQRVGNGLKAHTMSLAKEPTGRGRMTG